jgi:DNA-binding transcriptional ArsR family regulator/ubiquinone/menaquinone biosynthesis C-methylase UbiE
MLATQTSETTSPDADDSLNLRAVASFCKASGDPLRLLILRVLRQDSFGVQELCSIFDMRQPAMSHHLKVLSAAGTVASRREGNSIFYRRAAIGHASAPTPLQASLLETIDQLPLPAQLEQRLANLHQERERNSQQFFRHNADKFRAQQDLIASYEQYADTVAQVLAEAPLQKRHLALEVGPGDGAFLEELSPTFERVLALDNSAEMLERARQLAGERDLQNVDFLLGDTGHPDLPGIQADCIVVNMVLHHTPSPADIIADLANSLAGDGVLLVTDLCQHDQGWARESCGDLWLGFEPQDLSDWAGAAGLGEIASVYLAQRNGFQIQVRLFSRQANKLRK